MACDLTKGLNAAKCKDGTGGILEAYLINFESVSATTESDSLVSAIVMSGASLYYTFVPNKNSSFWTQEIQTTTESGSLGYMQSATLTFSKNQSDDISTIKLLARARTSLIIRERSDSGTRYFLLGKIEGCELSAGNFGSGTNMADRNGWELTFTANEPDPAPQVTASIISALLAT